MLMDQGWVIGRVRGDFFLGGVTRGGRCLAVDRGAGESLSHNIRLARMSVQNSATKER